LSELGSARDVLVADMLVVIIGSKVLWADRNQSGALCGDAAAHPPRSAAMRLILERIARLF